VALDLKISAPSRAAANFVDTISDCKLGDSLSINVSPARNPKALSPFATASA